MNRNTKLINLFVIGTFTALAGCDEAEIQDQGPGVVHARPAAQAADAGDAADELESSSKHTLEHAPDALDELTTSPRPAALCEGYNGHNYCWAKCADMEWHVVGHASVIPNGGCIEAGAKYCGGFDKLHGSCWGDL